MTTALISDCHLDPGDTFPHDLRGYERVFLVGDTFNLIPHGMSRWHTAEGLLTLRSVVDRVPLLQTDWVPGNHDPQAWLVDLLQWAGYKVGYRSKDVTISGHDYHITHGHEYAPDWRFLSKLAPQVVEMLTTGPLRQPWYWFCKRMGWIASGRPESSRRYAATVSMIWNYAAYDADQRGRTVILGHTHCPARWDNVWDLGCNEVVEL